MKILDRLPITKERASLRFGGRYIAVHPNQALVWMSVGMPGGLVPEATIPRFPALPDTGNNLGLSVQYRHLREWAGFDSGLLEPVGDLEINGQVVTCRDAAVWLYPNIPGRQDVAGGRPPFRLDFNKGIAVYSRDAVPPGPRLPLLGLPAFLENNLDFWLDPERQHISVQSRTWRTPLIRLLRRL